jgi:hypothetical protein
MKLLFSTLLLAGLVAQAEEGPKASSSDGDPGRCRWKEDAFLGVRFSSPGLIPSVLVDEQVSQLDVLLFCFLFR